MSVTAISPDLKISARNLQDLVLLCRPACTISFAARYFRDEREGRSSYLHALHALPFLLQRYNDFRSAACTIYCAIRSNKGSKGGAAAQRGACDANDISEVLRASVYGTNRGNGKAGATSAAALDAATNAEWEIDVVEGVLKEHLSALDTLDFDAFVVALRLHLSCFVIIKWVLGKVAENESYAETLSCLKK